MKSITAAKLLEFAMEVDDQEAVLMACSEKPWDHLDKAKDQYGATQGYSFKPLSTAQKQVQRAKQNRNGSIGQVRKSVAKCLTIMIDAGYRPPVDELPSLAQVDAFVFAKTILALGKLKDPIYTNLFHYLMNTSSLASSTTHACLDAGFDPNLQNDQGNTPLHLMWKHGLRVLSEGLYVNAPQLWHHTEIMYLAGARLDINNSSKESIATVIEQCIEKGLFHNQTNLQWIATAQAKTIATHTPEAVEVRRAGPRL